MINRYISFDPEPYYSNLSIHWEKEKAKVTNGSISLVPPFVKNRQIIIDCDSYINNRGLFIGINPIEYFGKATTLEGILKEYFGLTDKDINENERLKNKEREENQYFNRK